MKKLLLAALIAGSTFQSAWAADPATVNGVAIKQSLVDFIIKDAAAQGKQVDANARNSVIEKLITTEVIVQEVQKSGLDKQPDFVAKEQLTLQELRVNAYLMDYVQKNPIDDKMLRAEYDRLKAQTSDKEYKASHILVNTEAEAKSVIAELAKGGSFAALAKSHSLDGSKDAGGDLGWFAPETMVQPFAEAVVKLQKGGVTNTPVQTEFGWHVIKLEDVRDLQPPSFESVKDQLRSELQSQQIDNLVKGLRAKAKIVTSGESK